MNSTKFSSTPLSASSESLKQAFPEEVNGFRSEHEGAAPDRIAVEIAGGDAVRQGDFKRRTRLAFPGQGDLASAAVAEQERVHAAADGRLRDERRPAEQARERVCRDETSVRTPM